MRKLRICILCGLTVLAQLSCDTADTKEQPDQVVTVAGISYARFGQTWHTFENGRKGGQLVLEHLIVRPQAGVEINELDFVALGTPGVELGSGIVTGIYLLRLPQEVEPFEVADKLWRSGLFAELHFSVYGERLSG